MSKAKPFAPAVGRAAGRDAGPRLAAIRGDLTTAGGAAIRAAVARNCDTAPSTGRAWAAGARPSPIRK